MVCLLRHFIHDIFHWIQHFHDLFFCALTLHFGVGRTVFREMTAVRHLISKQIILRAFQIQRIEGRCGFHAGDVFDIRRKIHALHFAVFDGQPRFIR